MADPLEDPGYDFTLDDLINTFRPSQNYGEGMTGDQTARYDRVLELTGSKDLANIAASGDISSLLKNLGGAAKSFLTSPGGIASLGAILGTIDRPKPTGGGTTMAYPGAAKLERKMVQGPYGPLAEYTGVGGGAPDYTRFTAPKVEFPTVAPSPAPAPGGGLSVQAKVDLYKQLRGYGLSDERVRRISETMFGPQTDSDWAELTKRAGPVASGIASGAPAAPRTAAPAATPSPAPASSQGASTYKPTGMASWLQTSLSPTEKAAAYNAYLSNNMTDAEIRSMADQTFGKQSDSDWAELKRLAGTLPKDLLPSGKSFTDLQLKNAVKGFLDSSQQAKSGVPREEPSTFTGPPSLQVSQSSTPQQKAQEYQRLRQFGMSDSQIRAMVDTQMGKQTDSDWQALKSLAGETAAKATVGQTQNEDPFIKSLREAMGESSITPAYKDPTSGSTLNVKRDALGQPYEFTFTDSQGKSKTITPSSGTSLNFLENANALAKEYGIDLSKAFGAGSTAQGGNITRQDPGVSYLDPSLYATYGPMMAPGTPQQLVYSQEDQGLVYQPTVRGQDLGGVDFSSKAFDEVKNTLERFKTNPPKTQEELALANSAWNEYQNRFASGTTKQFGNVTKNVDKFGNDTGSYDQNLKPVGMLAQEYSQFGPLNELLSSLSSQAADETKGLSTTPFSHTANKLNSTLAALQANPLVQQTINRIAELDPSVKFTAEDVGNLSGSIQESGAENAIRNFIRNKQNLQAVMGATPDMVAGQNQTMSNPTFAAYQDLLNQITPKANQADWENLAARTSPGGNRQMAALWRDPTTGKGIGVTTNNSGVPAELVFYDASGQSLNQSAFTSEGLYREAEKQGIDLSNIGQLGSMLEQKKIGYKPGQLYAGTGSNAGIDFQDIAQGGLGARDDWTKLNKESQNLAERLGIQATSPTPAMSMIDPTTLTPQRVGAGLRHHVAYGPFGAAWYDTAAEAQAQAQKIGGKYANLAQGPIATNPWVPVTQTTEQPATQAGVQTATQAQPAAQPAAPRDLKSLLPSDWGSITDPSKKIDWFNQKKATEAELTAAGVKPEEIAWMRQNKLGTYARGGITQGYAHGGLVHMEDGGFVLTKKAVDGAGGPRGIQQLVPGARMVRGPGTGTSDDIPAVINGPRGQTPARLSNGEAYVPKRFVQAQGGPQRMYALMNNLQRKA